MEKQLSTAFLALILETFLILVLLVALIRTLKKLWHENTRVYLKLDEIKNIGLKVLKTDHSKGKKPILFIHRQKTRGM